MDIELAIIVLLLAASVVGMVVKYLRVPYTVALVLAGLGLAILRSATGLLPQSPLHLTPQLLLYILLPALIYEAAFHMELKEFRHNWRSILILAGPGVLLGLVATAFLAKLGLRFGVELRWAAAFLLAATLAATDPVSVIAIMKETNAPKRLRFTLEGESLFNDAVSVVAFGFIAGLAGAGGAHSALGKGLFPVIKLLLWEIGGGVVLGIAIGGALSWLISKVDDHLIEITMTTVAAFGSFLLAQRFHSSGVLACLFAGIASGNFGARYGMSPTTRVAVTSFWEYVAFAANSVVFMLIGLEIEPERLLSHAGAIAIVWLAMMAARGIVVAAASPVIERAGMSFRKFWPVVTWSGIRGALSMVLVLSLPGSFPFREVFLDIVFGCVLVCIVGQGVSFRWVLGELGLIKRSETEQVELLRAKLAAVNASLHFLHANYGAGEEAPIAVSELRERYIRERDRIEKEVASSKAAHEKLVEEEKRALARRLDDVERDAIRECYTRGLISENTFRKAIGMVDARAFAEEDE